jgi:hypothetical protein
MTTESKMETKPTTGGSGIRFRAPIWTLLVLSPFIAEVLSGATRVSVLFVLIPEVMVWGVGALLCRELVRRWRAGATSMLLLGLGLSIAEEFVIQQTSLAPIPWPGANASYGRLWGVNWVYLLFMLGFESVWVVLVPVGVTELIFPQHRDRAWLRKRGLVGCCFTFAFGSFVAWYSWTQQALPKKLHVPPYRPPLLTICLGLGAIGLLVMLAFLLRNFGTERSEKEGRPVPTWLAGVVALAMGAAWFELIGQIFVPHPIRPVWIPLAAGVAWCITAYVLFLGWSSRRGWTDMHRWWALFGATLGCEAMPYLSAAGWPRVDLYGKMVLDVLAIAWLLLLARKVSSNLSKLRASLVGQ